MNYVKRTPFRGPAGEWIWWPIPGRLGVIYGARFNRDIFSVRYGHTKVWDIGPFSIKWNP